MAIASIVFALSCRTQHITASNVAFTQHNKTYCKVGLTLQFFWSNDKFSFAFRRCTYTCKSKTKTFGNFIAEIKYYFRNKIQNCLDAGEPLQNWIVTYKRWDEGTWKRVTLVIGAWISSMAQSRNEVIWLLLLPTWLTVKDWTSWRQ